MMLRASFSPIAPFAIGTALAALWLASCPALVWLLKRIF